MIVYSYLQRQRKGGTSQPAVCVDDLLGASNFHRDILSFERALRYIQYAHEM